MRTFRVGIIALLHESNTFVNRRTSIDDFRASLLAEGDAIVQQMGDAHHEVGGFLAGLEQTGVEAVPLFAARALPSGTIDAETFDTLLAHLVNNLRAAMPLDGLLVAPHGATVSEAYPDADGHWLSQVRTTVGIDVPIVGTFDLHANLSAAMVDACDALIGYRENPHIDQRQRGIDAALLLHKTLMGEIKPTMALVSLPMAINIERQSTRESPMRELMQQADTMAQRNGVESNSIAFGFPYADVIEMGTSVVAITNNDFDIAHAHAHELARLVWDQRVALQGRFLDVATAVDRALAAAPPVYLLDMGDNVGGGSAADGTALAHELDRRRLDNSFICLCDPDAVSEARHAGIGAVIQMAVGGKTDQQHGEPWSSAFRVIRFTDGRFSEPSPRHGGITDFDQGPTAIVESEHGITVMLTSRRMVPFSLRQLTSCGLVPASYRILVAKGVNAPIAAYQEICRSFIRADTPGSTRADMTQLAYRRRRRPMYPFDPATVWPDSSSPVITKQEA